MNSATAAREEVQRVSIDTANDWKRIKSNFSSAAFAALDEILETSGSSVDKNALLPHIDQVRLCLVSGLIALTHAGGQDSSSKGRSGLHAPMFA